MMENITRLVEAFDRISSVFGSLGTFDDDLSLSKPEILALESIAKHHELIMSHLAKNLHIGFSQATKIIDHLAEKKLVSRERNQEDRRIVRVELTGRGKEVVAVYQKEKKDVFGKILKVISIREQESFVLILEKIAREIDRRSCCQIGDCLQKIGSLLSSKKRDGHGEVEK